LKLKNDVCYSKLAPYKQFENRVGNAPVFVDPPVVFVAKSKVLGRYEKHPFPSKGGSILDYIPGFRVLVSNFIFE
jgi:hypothetical protein